MEAKVIFLGSTNVGKTTILGTYRDGTFLCQTNPTIGIDKITIKHSPELTIQVYVIYLILQYWDTAGQERYNSVNFTYIKKADGVVLVYDPSEEDDQLKKNLNFWLETISNNLDIEEKKDYIWLVGNNKNNDKVIDNEEEKKRIKNLNLVHQIGEQRIIILNKIEMKIDPVKVNYFYYFQLLIESINNQMNKTKNQGGNHLQKEKECPICPICCC